MSWDTMFDSRIRAEVEKSHLVLEQLSASYLAEAQQSSSTMLLPPILSAPYLPLSREASPVHDPDYVAADSLFNLSEYLQQPHQRLDKIWSQYVSEKVSDGLNFLVSSDDLSLPRKSIVDLCLALPPNLQIQRQVVHSSLCESS